MDTNMTMGGTEALMALCREGLRLAEQLLEAGRSSVAGLVSEWGEVKSGLLEANQQATHGLAWQATYVETLRQGLAWATRLQAAGSFSAVEAAILRLGFAEYLQQMAGGIPISQTEMIRPWDLGVPMETVQAFMARPEVAALAEPGALNLARGLLAGAAAAGEFGAVGLEDETIEAIRDQFLRYAAVEIAPHAQGWHQRDELIPMEVVQQLGEMGCSG